MESKKVYKIRTAQFLLLLSITFLGAILRIWNIEREGLRLDEAQSVWQASHTLEYIHYYMSKNVHLPLHNSLLHFWMNMFGSGERNIRILSAIPGILTIPSMYFLANEILNKKGALFAAFVVAISPFYIWYSREIRMYTLLALTSTLSYFFYIRILKYNSFQYYLGYLIINIIGIYTHYFFLFVLLIQGMFFLLSWKVNFNENKIVNKKRQLVYFNLAAAVLFISYIPWIKTLIFSSNGIAKFGPALDIPTPFNIILTFFEFTFGYQPVNYTSMLLSLWPLLILSGFLFLEKRRNPFSPFLYLAILGILFPLIIVYIISVTAKPMYLTRYLTPMTPMYLILITWFLLEIKGKLKVVIIILFLFTTLTLLYNQFTNPDNPEREDYKSAVEYLNSNTDYRDAIVIAPPFVIYPFQYYYDGKSTTYTMPIWNKKKGGIPELTNDSMVRDSEKIKEGHKRIFLLLATNLENTTEVKNYYDMHYTKLQKIKFSEHLWIHVYQAEYLYSRVKSMADNK